MKSEILREINEFYYETAEIPRYRDLIVSRYLIISEFGSLEDAIKESEIGKIEYKHNKLTRRWFPQESIGSALEREMEYFVLTKLRWPRKKDCNGDLLKSSYSTYLNYLGPFNKSTLFYDDLRTRLTSKKDILNGY